jgi:ABC-type uncharacterized transport system permease subunit
MQRATQVPSSLITAINGLVVMFVVASDVYVRRLRRRAAKEATSSALAEESVSSGPGSPGQQPAAT